MSRMDGKKTHTHTRNVFVFFLPGVPVWRLMSVYSITVGFSPGLSMYVCMYGRTYSKSMDQPGKVANPARGQLNRENQYFSVRVRA